jgi:hypothetical protein
MQYCTVYSTNNTTLGLTATHKVSRFYTALVTERNTDRVWTRCLAVWEANIRQPSRVRQGCGGGAAGGTTTYDTRTATGLRCAANRPELLWPCHRDRAHTNSSPFSGELLAHLTSGCSAPTMTYGRARRPYLMLGASSAKKWPVYAYPIHGQSCTAERPDLTCAGRWGAMR